MVIRLFFFIFLCGCGQPLFAMARIDSMLQRLTLAEKVDLLFVDRSDSLPGDTLMLFHQYPFLHGKEMDIDTVGWPMPNAYTLSALTDSNLIHQFYKGYYAAHISNGLCGVLVPDRLPNVGVVYTGRSKALDDLPRIIDFPCELLDKQLFRYLRNEGEEDIDYAQIGMPLLGALHRPLDAAVSFREMMKFNYLFWQDGDETCRKLLLKAFETGFLSGDILDAKLRRLMRYVMGDASSVRDEVRPQRGIREQVFCGAVSAYQRRKVLPLNRVDTLSCTIRVATDSDVRPFIEKLKRYHPQPAQEVSNALRVLVSDSLPLLREALADYEEKGALGDVNVLVYGGILHRSDVDRLLPVFDVLILMPQRMHHSWSMMAQALYGGLPLSGQSALDSWLQQQGFQRVNTAAQRLSYALIPETAFPRDSMAKIDSIVHDAIREKATPGAQLLVVKNGRIVVDKCYGHHTYDKQQEVKRNDLYDVASITKLAVTFPLVMKLYEQGRIDLEATLSEYIPGIDTTDKGDITLRELLVHQSGLISYLPFHINALDRSSLGKRTLYSRHYSRLYNIRVDTRLYQNKNARFRSDVFNKKEQGMYTRQVSKGLFMNESYVDSMYAQIYASKRYDKTYRYSDLGYYLLQKVIERQAGMTIDQLFNQVIASRLGASRMLYRPLERFADTEIIPTENDLAFRRSLLDGYVHDQGAAMLGGVGAHAGLFATAGDLAKLGQLLLNEGTYGGQRFIKPETIGRFTQTVNHGNRRGLGVDKPELEPGENSHVSQRVSAASYGHTGFTGTIFWLDPEHNLMYIFLSNRIHPWAYNKKLIEMNVRTQIQDVIYNSLVPH
ncbi:MULTISPECIES: serine hydrolase domain-containing protein [unclassified Carboxylicivirga]|uniref:serine hydrolase domain-containing protein n=1 Tax=Carboxylicivirga TaxID=1628153 RepID=UPI003D34C761